MTPFFIFLMTVSNYLHDLAAVSFLASGLVVSAALRRRGDGASFLKGFRRMKTLAAVSLVWISGGAVPRMMTFSTFELYRAVEKGQTLRLAAEHISLFLIVLSGSLLWMFIGKEVRALAAESNGGR